MTVTGGRVRVVGRARERAVLVDALRSAAGGSGGVVLLTGEGGIGKTTLANEVAELAAAQGMRVVHGQGWEGRGAPPLVVWHDVLRALGVGTTALGPATVLAALVEAGARAPLLVVVEDLHAADADSARVVAYLSSALTTANVLVLVTCRPDELLLKPGAAEALEQVSTACWTVPVPLLDDGDARELATQLLGEHAPRDLVDGVVERSDGNAFYLRELAQTSAPLHLVPAGVAAAVRRRIGGLPAPTRELLALAACAGRDVDLRLLADAAGRDPMDVLEALEPALAVGAVEDRGGGAVRFRHALVAEALVAGLPPTQRARHARAVADALQRRPVVHAASVVHHLETASALTDPLELAAWSVRAGEEAAAARAQLEAVRHWRRAVQLLAPGGDVRQQARLHERIAHALFASGTDSDEAVAALERALAGYEQVGDQRCAAVVHSRLGAHLAVYRSTTAARVERHFAAAAKVLVEPLDRARLLVGTASLHVLTGDVRVGLAEAQQAEAVATEAGRGTLAASARLLRGAHLLHLGRLAEGFAALDASIADGQALLDVQAAWHGMTAGVVLEDAALTESYAERARQALRAVYLPGQDRLVSDNMAPARAMVGEIDDAHRQLGSEDLLGFPGLVATYAGDWAAASARLASLVERDASAGQRLRETLGCWALGWTSRLEHRLDDARTWLSRPLEHAQRQGRVLDELRLRAELTLVETAAGDAAAAGEHLQRCRAVRPTGEDLRGLGVRLDLAEAAVRREGFAPVLAAADRLRLSWLALDVLARWAEAEPLQVTRLTDEVRRRLAVLRAEDTAWRVLAVPPAGPTHVVELRADVSGWRLTTSARSTQLADSKGLRHLARLLAEPGREWHALDLVALLHGAARSSRERDDGGPLIDATARSAYRRRLAELAEQLEEAEQSGDGERAARVRSERDALVEHLAAATGLGGRDRGHARDAERARQSVTKTLRSAVDRVAEVDPALGDHLRSALQTGTFTAYKPDPMSHLRWRVAQQ